MPCVHLQRDGNSPSPHIEPPGECQHSKFARSESISDVDPVSARLPDQCVVKAQRAGVKIFLVQRISEVLPVRDVLDPCSNDVTALFRADALEGQPRVRDMPIGRTLPMFCTAAGRAYLSRLPAEEVNDILDRSVLRSLTPNTVTDRKRVLDLI